MWITFSYTLRRFRGQIVGWGIGLFLIGLLMVSVYDSIADQQEQFDQIMQIYPEELFAFFGDFTEFSTPKGFLSIEFFSFMPLILGIFAIIAGSGLLVDDEEGGRLDLIMAYPITRSGLLFGRLLAFLVASIVICLIAWLGLAVPTLWSTMDVSFGELILPIVSLMVEIILFGVLALFLSLLFPSRRLAAMVAGILLVASFFITGLAGIISELEGVARFSPLNYYQGGDAMSGLNLEWLAGLIGAMAFFALLSWWLFKRREIRVGGEGTWTLPIPLLRMIRRRGKETMGGS